MQAEQLTEEKSARRSSSRVAIYMIFAFFLILTALAIYVMIAYPQPGP